MVKLDFGDFDIPLSISGGQVSKTVGPGTHADMKTFTAQGPNQNDVCNQQPLFIGDVMDFVTTGALPQTVLKRMATLLPDWLHIADTGRQIPRMFKEDLTIKFVDGGDIQSLRACKGLPATPGVTYAFLGINRDIRLTLAGRDVVLSADVMDDVCVLFGICGPNNDACRNPGRGPASISMLIAIPESAVRQLQEVSPLKVLALGGTEIKAMQFGIGGQLQANEVAVPLFWNGKSFFAPCAASTKYNLYIGGRIVQRVGDIDMQLDGKFYMSTSSSTCGAWDDLFTGPYTVFASAKLDFQLPLLPGRCSAVFVGAMPCYLKVDGTVALTAFVGGSANPTTCTTTAKCANHEGIFFTGRLKGFLEGTFLSGVFYEKALLEKLEVEVDAYLLASKRTILVPKLVNSHVEAAAQVMLQILTSALAELSRMLAVGRDEQARSQLEKIASTIETNLQCQSGGVVQCWFALPHFQQSVKALQGLTTLLHGASSPVNFRARMQNILDKVNFSMQQLARNAKEAVASQLTSTFTDRARGYGLRFKAGFHFGLIRYLVPWLPKYFGLTVELQYGSSADLLSCDDKFAFVMEKIFQPFLSGRSAITANLWLLWASGGGSPKLLFDEDQNTAWNPQLYGHRNESFATNDGTVSVIFASGGADHVEALQVCLPDCVKGSCPASARLEIQDNGEWLEVFGYMPLLQSKGCQKITIAPELQLSVARGAVWRVIFSSLQLDGTFNVSQRHSNGSMSTLKHVAISVTGISLLGSEPRHAFAFRLTAEAHYSLALAPDGILSKIKVDVTGTSALHVMVGIDNEQMNGNFLIRAQSEASVLGVTARVALFWTYEFVVDQTTGEMGSLTSGSMTLALQGDVWGMFSARFAVTMYIAKQGSIMPRAFLNVHGSFDRRVSEYIANAVRKLLRFMSEAATKAADACIDVVDSAQQQVAQFRNKVRQASDWLEKKSKVFTDAKQQFSRAQTALTKAKAPVQRLRKKLKDAQNKVNRLCRMKKCKWNRPHNCVWNAFCGVVRAAAYAVLAVARFILTIPLLVLDAAIMSLDVASIAMDAAKSTVDIARGGLDFVQRGLSTAERALDRFKQVCEMTKKAVSFGLQVAEKLLIASIGQMFDVRRVSFDAVIDTVEPSIITLTFDVTVLGSDIDGIKFKFDFSRLLASVSALVDFIVELVQNMPGQRRRRQDVATRLDQLAGQDWPAIHVKLRERVTREVTENTEEGSTSPTGLFAGSSNNSGSGSADAGGTVFAEHVSGSASDSGSGSEPSASADSDAELSSGSIDGEVLSGSGDQPQSRGPRPSEPQNPFQNQTFQGSSGTITSIFRPGASCSCFDAVMKYLENTFASLLAVHHDAENLLHAQTNTAQMKASVEHDINTFSFASLQLDPEALRDVGLSLGSLNKSKALHSPLIVALRDVWSDYMEQMDEGTGLKATPWNFKWQIDVNLASVTCNASTLSCIGLESCVDVGIGKWLH